ncbi:MAG: hypothetical protein HZC40_08115 [Chloroflexi bacterium]|nr:hypothetical protein [Chloroflexota bacterium]
MNALTFNLRLCEPILATQPESGEENSARAYGFIPGSLLRGALIARYRRVHPQIELTSDGNTRRLFLDGTVRYLNAYPWLPSRESRMLPTPLSWFTEKNEAHPKTAKHYDFAVAEAKLENAKDAKVEFCPREADVAQLYAAVRQLNVHNQSEDRVRKQAGQSTVYRYEAIAAGQVFSAAILVETKSDADTLAALLGDALILGGSHTAGYGRVDVQAIEYKENWREYAENTWDDRDKDKYKDEDEDEDDAREKPFRLPPNRISVTLLSDTLVRDENGTPGDFTAALARRVGVSKLDRLAAFQRARLVGGFKRTADLPLNQAWAIQAGSVFVYLTEQVTIAQLRALETQGLGERRVEGFGRIAVNWHTRATFAREDFVPVFQTERKITLRPASIRVAQAMANRQLRALLNTQLLDVITETIIKDAPENAQLARVRAAAQQSVVKTNLEDVTTLMKNIAKIKNAKEQWERAHIDGVSLFDWVVARAKKLDLEAQLKFTNADLPRVAGQTAQLDQAMRVEYLARLMDGLMQKISRERQQAARIQEAQ